LGLVNGVAVEIKAKKLEKLAETPGLTVVEDAAVKQSGTFAGFSSTQLWPFESGDAATWLVDAAHPQVLPAIAIVDSGIDANRPDFDGRVLAQVNLATAAPNSVGDGRGHGTFVAGIAAGEAPGYAGAAPGAPLVSLDVMNDTGMAWTSDVIAAAQWIL